MKYRKIKTLVVAILVSSSLVTSSVFAKSISDLEKESQEIEKNIEDSKNQIADKKETLESINAEIDKLDKELTTAMSELTTINNKLADVTKQLEDANIRLVEATKEKEAQQDTLEKRIRYMYEFGEVSYLETIMDSKSFSDLLNRVEYLNTIHEFDQNMYNELEAREKEITELVATIDSSKQEIEVLQKQATQKRDELQANVEQKEALNRKISKDINLLNKQLEAEEQASKNVEAMIQAEIKRQQELAAQQNNKPPVKYTGGKLMWPSDTTRISDPYGWRPKHPITGKSTMHSGVDIAAYLGTNVYSAESGTVLSAGWISGYGNAVIIMHDNGLTTLYGHLSSYNVSAGDRVTRGQVIALCGNTGNSTGPHIHFEVRLDGVAVNPMDYVQ